MRTQAADQSLLTERERELSVACREAAGLRQEKVEWQQEQVSLSHLTVSVVSSPSSATTERGARGERDTIAGEEGAGVTG